jgi:hypothetical protein
MKSAIGLQKVETLFLCHDKTFRLYKVMCIDYKLFIWANNMFNILYSVRDVFSHALERDNKPKLSLRKKFVAS